MIVSSKTITPLTTALVQIVHALIHLIQNTGSADEVIESEPALQIETTQEREVNPWP